MLGGEGCCLETAFCVGSIVGRGCRQSAACFCGCQMRTIPNHRIMLANPCNYREQRPQTPLRALLSSPSLPVELKTKRLDIFQRRSLKAEPSSPTDIQGRSTEASDSGRQRASASSERSHFYEATNTTAKLFRCCLMLAWIYCSKLGIVLYYIAVQVPPSCGRDS